MKFFYIGIRTCLVCFPFCVICFQKEHQIDKNISRVPKKISVLVNKIRLKKIKSWEYLEKYNEKWIISGIMQWKEDDIK